MNDDNEQNGKLYAKQPDQTVLIVTQIKLVEPGFVLCFKFV